MTANQAGYLPSLIGHILTAPHLWFKACLIGFMKRMTSQW